MASLLQVDWARAQTALRAEVARTAELLRSLRNPSAPAVGQWTAAEVAVHLSQAWLVVPGLARRDLSAIHEVLPHLAGTAGESLVADIWALGGVTMEGVRAEPERDPNVLASRIEERAAAWFAACEGRSAGETGPWLCEGVAVPLATLTCHLLNETVMHAADIAAADGRRWSIDPGSAALVIQGFVVPVFDALGPALVDAERAAGLRATYLVRLRGGGRFALRIEDGSVSTPVPLPERADCHLSADPVALLEVMWGRRSQWGAIATGRLVAWGRRPWLGPRLRAVLRNP